MNAVTAPLKEGPEQVKVRIDEIADEPLILIRDTVDWHVKALVSALQRRRRLDEVKLWRNPEGRLVLLDGAHRLTAYRWKGITAGIPALVFTCSRDEALVEAVKDNAKNTLPLTASQRSDVAWRIVRDPEAGLSKAKIAAVTGVSERTVAAMRARLKTMGEAGQEPSGFWFMDRDDSNKGPDKPIMTDQERKALVEQRTKAILDTMGWRAASPHVREMEVNFEAVAGALGQHLPAFVEYLGDILDPHGLVGIEDDGDVEIPV